jgi:hypothetical protein
MEVMLVKKWIAILPLALGLTACSGSDEPEQGTSLNVDATTETGSKVEISADGKTGNVGVKVPGFDANIRLPKKLLNDSDFDIDGVKLYPGSTVETVNIAAHEKGDKRQSDVRVGFTSPAEPAKVAGWLREQFAKQSIPVSGDAASLSGKTKDGETFTIDLKPSDDGKTSGTVNIRE